LPTVIDEKALADVRPQAIPLDYAAHEAVRHIVAGAHKAGLGRQVAELEKSLQAAQKALAEFDAINVRDALK
jgi:hypothetical protein